MIELQHIARTRKSLGMTQHELAKRAGVSQSLIAKIEYGRLEPSYSIAKRILQILEHGKKKSSLKAKDVMTSRCISIHPKAKLTDAIQLMKKHSISQMPVIEHHVLGIVTESDLLADVHHPGDAVEKIMQVAPPILNPESDLDIVVQLLGHYSLVLIAEKGVICGVITKADVLKTLL